MLLADRPKAQIQLQSSDEQKGRAILSMPQVINLLTLKYSIRKFGKIIACFYAVLGFIEPSTEKLLIFASNWLEKDNRLPIIKKVLFGQRL